MPRESAPWTRRPATIVIAFFLLLTLGLCLVSLWLCQGQWTYAFDDPYIHLAIAHNLVYSGVWGVAPDTYASASSSPLWTVLLAGILRIWNSDLVPLVLNVISGVGALILVGRAWKESWATERLSDKWQTVGLLVLCLAVPLPMLALIGMEHSLQLFCDLGLVVVASRVLGERRSARSLPLWAFLVGGMRPEGIFLAGWTAVALALQKRFKAALAVLGSAAVPFAVYGYVSVSHGWGFAPASTALKYRAPAGSVRGVLHWAKHSAQLGIKAWPLLAMVALACLLARRVSSPVLRAALALFALTALAHSVASTSSYFFRYEAYLYGLGIAVLWPALFEVWPRKFTRSALSLGTQAVALVVIGLWAVRSVMGVWQGPLGTRNIYMQQKQMTRFITQFYPDETVILNDIGTTDWAAANRPGGHAAFDLVGLSQREIAQFRLHQRDMILYPSVSYRLIAEQHLRMGIVYDRWFDRHIFPPDWVRVAQWDTGYAYVAAFDRVSFWTTKANAARLKSQLQEFKKELPPGVETIWTDQKRVP